MPRTTLGKWSVGLIGFFCLSLITLILLAASGQRGGETLFSNPLLAAAGISAASAGTAAFIIGMASILWRKERSALVFIAVAIGLYATLSWIGEILFPH